MNLRKSFVLPRNVVDFTRNRGVELSANDVQNIYDEKGYPSTMDAHELVTRLEEKQEKHEWCVNVVKDARVKLTHVFQISIEQIIHARRFLHLILHDSW